MTCADSNEKYIKVKKLISDFTEFEFYTLDNIRKYLEGHNINIKNDELLNIILNAHSFSISDGTICVKVIENKYCAFK